MREPQDREMNFNNLVVQLWFVKLCWSNPAEFTDLSSSVFYLNKFRIFWFFEPVSLCQLDAGNFNGEFDPGSG